MKNAATTQPDEVYELTEVYRFAAADDFTGAPCSNVIAPGLISGEYAKKIFGRDFELAVRLGVLVLEKGSPSKAEAR